jgi:hypothetical protein
MAIVITQPKRGTVGASVFLQSRYGVMERQRVIPLNPKTLAQQNQRSVLAAVASEWRGLTDPVRANWEALAKAMPGKLTGFLAYVEINATLVKCGMPKLEVAPLRPAFGIPSCTGLVVDDTPGVKLTQVSDTVAPDKFIIEATAPVAPGIRNVNSRFRRLTVVAGHAGPAVDLDLTAAYSAQFGAPVAGQRVVVRLTPMKDGFKGIPLEFNALVAAQGA